MPNKITVVQVMQKADSIPSDGTAADSEQKVEDTSVSQHSRKPFVVGCQSHGTLTFEQVGETANKILPHLYGLSKTSVEGVLEWVNNTVNSYYFLSNPNDLRNS
jgi:hypothetical protein